MLMSQSPLSQSPHSPVSPTAPINHSRYYTARTHPGIKYVLPSDEDEKDRLALQHGLLKELFDNELLPPYIELHAGDKVLDSATGTGVWVEEVATTVPKGVTVHGFDVEPRLLPKHHAANTTFTLHSLLDLPSNWSSTYAVVHQRFLIAGLDWSAWQNALQIFKRVLKPGGYLILEELCHAAVHLPDDVEISTYIPYTQRFCLIMERLFVSKNLLLNCGDRLPWILGEAGFDDVRLVRKSVSFGPYDEGWEWKDVMMGFYKGMMGPVLKAGGFGLVHSEDEWDELMHNMEIEWNTHRFVLEYMSLTARKPLQLNFVEAKAKVNEGFP